ncbi:hypothetical protein C3L33_04209, partial [Rhododendron williamsianum]
MSSSSKKRSTSSPIDAKVFCYRIQYDVLDYVPKLFFEGNYNNWKLLMRNFIHMQGLIGFIEGAAVEERDRDEAWKRSNNLVQEWILKTLSGAIRPRVMSSDESAKGLWMRLEEIFDPTRSTWQPDGTYPYPTEFNVLEFVPILLSEGNYKNWKSSMWDFISGLGLVAFIDGTAAVNKSNRDDYTAWKRLDNLVRRWILATLSRNTRIRVLRFKTAEVLWTELEKMFDATRSLWQLDEETESRQGHFLDLHKAAINGDWDKAKEIIEREPNAVRTPITPFHETALSLAIKSASEGRNHFVRELLERMTPQDVVHLVDNKGRTALHHAARVGNVEGARMLVNKNRDLPTVEDYVGTPLHWAALLGLREMVLYLKEVTSEEIGDSGLLFYLTSGEHYDIALTLLQRKPELALKACMELDNPFSILVEKRSSFPSGKQGRSGGFLAGFSGFRQLRLTATFITVLRRLAVSFVVLLWVFAGGVVVPGEFQGNQKALQGIIAKEVEEETLRIRPIVASLFMIWELAEKLEYDFTVPHVKHIREMKERQHHALELVKFLCMEVAKSNLSLVERIFKPALRNAARVGIPEIIEEIVVSYPLAITFMDLDNLNIFKYAILYRRERVFNLINQVAGGTIYIGEEDTSRNHGLHLAARLSRVQQINLKASAAGAILQMQREMQWFK